MSNENSTTQDRRPRAVNVPQHYAPLHIRRRWFDGDDDAGDPPTPPPDTTPAKGGQDGGSTGLTQADVDRIIADRLKRDREAQRKQWLEGLGYDSEDALKADVQAKREADAASKTELEQAQAAVEAANKKVAEAEARAAQALETAKEERRNTAILNAVKDAEKPASVLTLLIAEHAEDVAALMTDDGSIDAKKVEALATVARKEYAGMFPSGSPGSPSNHGGKVPQPDQKVKDEVRRNIRVRY